MTPELVLLYGFILVVAGFAALWYFERRANRRWAEQAAERIWENRDKWLKRG